MSTFQRISLAAAMFVLLAVVAVLGWMYQIRQARPAPATATAPVEVTSSEDRGPGSLREALFIVAAAPGKASITIRTRTIALKTPLPPLLNAHGVSIVAEPAGVEIDARALPAGPVFDVSGANSSLAGVVVRHCPAAAILLRAARFHLQSSTIESCDVGVEVAENASDVLLEHNSFANDRLGVRFAGASRDSVVIGNHFVQSKDAGLWIVRGGGDVRGGAISVRENHFSGNRNGIVAGNIPVVIERNEFTASTEGAVHLIGGGAIVRGNRIGGGPAMGIIAENARDSVIDGNELDHFGTYAIMVHGTANALVRGNRIHNCAYGLAFVVGDPRSPSTAVDNTIIEPKFNGIDVIGDSPILKRNQVLRPHALALHVVDYQPPAGQKVQARPFLEGNNFRADEIQAAAAADPTAGELAQRQ